MTETALSLSLFGGSQEPLPGMPAPERTGSRRRPKALPNTPAQIPLMVAVHELGQWPLRPAPGPGQLTLGPNQMELAQLNPEPIQLTLFDDPPPWEPL